MNRRVILGLALVAVGLLVFLLVNSLPHSPPSPAEPEYVIALDPGHGGKDPGAAVDGVAEKDLNLAIVKRLQKPGRSGRGDDIRLGSRHLVRCPGGARC